jgi:formylglycine-generating enzyme required for sulfatase activity
MKTSLFLGTWLFLVVFVSGNGEPQCVPVTPASAACFTESDCAGTNDATCAGSTWWTCENATCLAHCDPAPAKVEAGGFWMGSPGSDCPAGYPGDCIDEPGRRFDEELHYVLLTRPFEIQPTEVTQGDWKRAFGGWNPTELFLSCGDSCPVETVSWYDAAAYANQRSVAKGLAPCYGFDSVLCRDQSAPVDDTDYAYCMDSERGGIRAANVVANGVATPYECVGYRLPTEAEWEMAYRAGSWTAIYPTDGNDGSISAIECEPDPNLTQIAWYCGNNPAGSMPVGGRIPNAWGLFDMAGNKEEWVWDWYDFYGPGSVDSPDTDPAGAEMEFRKTVKGGCVACYAFETRAAARNFYSPDHRRGSLGFRLARTIAE